MKKLLLVLSVSILWMLTASWAQTPNEFGVRGLHLHVVARDVAAETKIWTTIGGTLTKIDGMNVIKYPPELLVFITQGTPKKNNGNVLDHVVFSYKPGMGAKMIERMRALGVSLKADGPESPDDADLRSTEDLRIDNNGEEKQVEPILASDVRYDIPARMEKDVVAWYAKVFGFKQSGGGVRVPGLARGFDFSLKNGNPNAPQPSKGYSLDHIGFEVANLEQFVKRLEANGIKFDKPYSKTRNKSFASAELTDPWGTTIELTEGLSRF